MYLEIPLKLEHFVEAIKKQSKYIDPDSDKITLLQVGKASGEEHIKLMYLIFNPHITPINVSLNLFNDVKYLYKMYPSEFVVLPNTIAAFVVYSSKDMQLSINEDFLQLYFKRNIDNRLMRMKNISFTGKYKNSLIYNINDAQVSVDKTIMIDKKTLDEVIEYKAYNPQHDLLQINLETINKTTSQYQFVYKMINDTDQNIFIKRIKMKIYDKDKKYYININQKINFKQHSSKKITISVSKDDISNIDFQQMQIKISVI